MNISKSYIFEENFIKASGPVDCYLFSTGEHIATYGGIIEAARSHGVGVNALTYIPKGVRKSRGIMSRKLKQRVVFKIQNQTSGIR